MVVTVGSACLSASVVLLSGGYLWSGLALTKGYNLRVAPIGGIVNLDITAIMCYIICEVGEFRGKVWLVHQGSFLTKSDLWRINQNFS